MAMTAHGPITYRWVEGYTEDYDPTGIVATGVLMTSWTDAFNFPVSMLGANMKAGASINRIIPEDHPEIPYIYCTSLKLLNGIGGITEENSGFLKYSEMVNGVIIGDGRAVWQANFTSLNYEVLEDENTGGSELNRYVERKSQASVEALPIPGTAFKWSTAPQNPIPEAVTRLFPTVSHEYTWHWVPEGIAGLPESTWRAALGKVNSVAFDAGVLNAAAETVLFMGYRKDGPIRDALGGRCWNVTFQFKQRPSGWNKLMRRFAAAAPDFDTVIDTAGAGTTGIYAITDLNALFALA